MGSAREDFQRFIRWLHVPATNASEPVRRLGNLVLDNFEVVAETARQHNNRAAVIATLARQHLATASAALPDMPDGQGRNGWPWRRIRSLTIGPFRGFRREESFELKKRIALIYGPNGSGKTSLCTALEYALLGQVQDAELKRVELHQYLTNIHARRFAAPRLVAVDERGRDVAVVASEDTFRFCFIERNRIDAFARMAARPPGARAELIATLFGMEQFSEFVSHFNDSIDAVLTTRSELAMRLNDRRQIVAHDEQMVAIEAATLRTLEDEEASLAQRCKTGLSYVDLKTYIGNQENPGRLEQLDNALNEVPPALIGITRLGLAERYAGADRAADRHGDVVRQLEQRASQVAFKELYQAISTLQPTEGDHCPACDTPLASVARNPFDKAAAGLRELRDLSELQEEAARLRELAQDDPRPRGEAPFMPRKSVASRLTASTA